MKRLFTAINISPEMKEMLYDQALMLVKNGRAIKKENLHITLTFIGNVEDNKVDGIKKIIREAAYGVPAFTMKLKSIEPVKEGEMIWATFEKNGAFVNLCNNISSTLKTKKDKPQTPHITLARVKAPIKEHFYIPLEGEFIVNRIGLYESVLKPEGAKYTLIEESNLS